jgi:hypothetical protein
MNLKTAGFLFVVATALAQPRFDVAVNQTKPIR